LVNPAVPGGYKIAYNQRSERQQIHHDRLINQYAQSLIVPAAARRP